MSLNSNAVQPPITPQLQDTGLPAALPPSRSDVANPSEPTLSNRAAINSSVEIVDEVNQLPTAIAEHSAPEKSPRSTNAILAALPNTTDDSLENLKQAALSGDKEAQFNVGKMYYKGEVVEVNKEKAFDWFHKAAVQGYLEAQFSVAVMYDQGEGVRQNKEKAFEWFHKAAVQGYLDAQFDVAVMYDEGEGVEVNKEKAFEWYHRAAVQGDLTAQFSVAIMYDEGEGVEVNKEKAFEWFKKAAEQGNHGAMQYLCDFYNEGQGVEKNLPLATYWLLKYYFESTNIDSIDGEYNQLFEFIPSTLANFTEFEEVSSISFNGWIRAATLMYFRMVQTALPGESR